MRLLALCLGLSTVSWGVAALDDLSDYVKKIPNCSLDAFRDALKEADCKVDKIDSSTFDCLCDHIGSIPIAVARDVETGCSAGSTCGMWMADPSKSEQAEAEKILAEKFDGKGGDNAPTKTDPDSKSGSGSAPETSATDDAAVGSRIPSIVGLAGGAIAVAAGLML